VTHPPSEGMLCQHCIQRDEAHSTSIRGHCLWYIALLHAACAMGQHSAGHIPWVCLLRCYSCPGCCFGCFNGQLLLGGPLTGFGRWLGFGGCGYGLRLRQGLGARLCEAEGLRYCGSYFLLPAAAAAASCSTAACFPTILHAQHQTNIGYSQLHMAARVAIRHAMPCQTKTVCLQPFTEAATDADFTSFLSLATDRLLTSTGWRATVRQAVAVS
jgi:hypothetical protein